MGILRSELKQKKLEKLNISVGHVSVTSDEKKYWNHNVFQYHVFGHMHSLGWVNEWVPIYGNNTPRNHSAHTSVAPITDERESN